MPSRISRRNPVARALKRIPQSKLGKVSRAIIRASIKWYNLRHERPKIKILAHQLQIPADALTNFIKKRRDAPAIVNELEQIAQLAQEAGYGPKKPGEIFKTGDLFRQFRDVERVRRFLEQQAQGPMAAAA